MKGEAACVVVLAVLPCHPNRIIDDAHDERAARAVRHVLTVLQFLLAVVKGWRREG